MAPSTVFQAFFAIVLGTASLGQISPNVSAVAEGIGAAAQLYEILDTTPEIDASRDVDGSSIAPSQCNGDVTIQGVHFAYPSRPEAPILRGLDVHIPAGQTVAFVGPSGGGKSTIVSLLERFYDPQQGAVRLDGRDLRGLHVRWLRAQIGLVSQEPVLFATSIFENIASGLSDDESRANVKREDVERAAKLANAHDFIMSLPQQYDTYVGEKGVALSGGQKQRIAIARAIIRDPKILVLDEATSALDNESERVVQAALTQVMQDAKRTTVVIAHRLSTVRNANKIVVLSSGVAQEQGTHEELMRIQNGVYRGLYELQAKREKNDEHFDDTFDSTAEVERPRDCANTTPSRVRDTKQASATAPSEETENDAPGTSAFTLADAITFSAPEQRFFVSGMAAAIFQGLSLPASALLISDLIATMTHEYSQWQASLRTNLNAIKGDVLLYAIIYFVFAVTMGAAHTVQVVCFRTMAEKLTTRLRLLHFRSLCSMDISFFDKPAHATGTLSAELATNAVKVSLLSGDTPRRIVQAVTMFVASLLLSFLTGSVLLTLVLMALFPLIIVGEAVRARQMRSALMFTDQLGEAGGVASQALTSVRTVMALGMEMEMCRHFSTALEKPCLVGQREARVNGAAIGYSSFVIFATYALVFWYGGTLVEDAKITFKELLRSLMAIILSAQGIGQAVSWLGEVQHAFNAGGAILRIRDYPRSINSFDDNADNRQELAQVRGRLEFRNVTFRYPTRPEVTVLDGFNLTVESNQTIGVCGPSGGGKSTIVSLLERFYDPESGQVLLDGHDLRALKVQWLRRQIGYVGQEPTLFMGTIAENIAYGLESLGDEERPTQEDIERAARLANAHDFISNLPEGYATQVGAKGEQLSGGQKQRIAIARALLRNPKLLILDEATSALDSESERIVQQALDEVVAARARTTIVIAHRLSTIRNADKIVVVERGRVVEQGTHSELMRLPNGVYQGLLAETEQTN
ncbi:hypothetical protein PINS_up019632 [Pythium insidiosum]|nr:hypothetical protein PINS_up019632 [Pythium insidiosum]